MTTTTRIIPPYSDSATTEYVRILNNHCVQKNSIMSQLSTVTSETTKFYDENGMFGILLKVTGNRVIDVANEKKEKELIDLKYSLFNEMKKLREESTPIQKEFIKYYEQRVGITRPKQYNNILWSVVE
jgi:hypothetical protein